MISIGFWRPPDLGKGFSDRVRAGLQKEVPETVFWSEKHDSIFKNAIWHFPSFLLFFALVVSYPGGSRMCRAASKEVSGGQGKPTAPERWPESSGRGLGDDFLIEAFSCHVSSFSVLLCFWGVSRWFQEVKSCVPGGPWRSGEA